MLTASTIIAFFIATCIMTMAYIKHLKCHLNSLDGMDMSMDSERKKFREGIFEFIRFHTHAKQLSIQTIFLNFLCEFSWGNIFKFSWRIFFFITFWRKCYWFNENGFSFRCIIKFVTIYNAIFTIYFVWSLLTICGSLLIFQMELVECIFINFLMISL